MKKFRIYQASLKDMIPCKEQTKEESSILVKFASCYLFGCTSCGTLLTSNSATQIVIHALQMRRLIKSIRHKRTLQWRMCLVSSILGYGGVLWSALLQFGWLFSYGYSYRSSKKLRKRLLLSSNNEFITFLW